MRRFTFITVISLLFSLGLSAQTVDEIVTKHLAAQGGVAKLRAVQSVRMTGEFNVGDMRASFTQLYKRPIKMRLDISIQGMTMTQAFDGQSGWQIVPFTGKKDPAPMAGEDLKHAREQADIDGPLLDYKTKGNIVQLVGKEKTAEGDAYHLKVTLKSGDVRDLYLDATTFLVKKIVAKTTMQGAEVELESTIGDYRQVDGLMFPFSIEQHAVTGQAPAQKITFTKIEANVPVDDGVFKMPAAPADTTGPAPK